MPNSSSRAALPATPIDAGERLYALDILRGLALFGMILVHFHQKMRRPVAGLEDLIGWGVYVLVEQKGFGLIQDQWLCFTYIGAVVLLLAYRPRWTDRLAVFGQAGRMALTNYMLQAAVLDVLSSGYGFGLTVRPLMYAPATVLLFGLEAAASRAWLARFRFGPLEWVWRTMTYWKPQPIWRVTASQAPESV